ncbi:hypothetical protein CsSME_00052070 [Camellia sinensis var. sinensis]
MGNLLTLTSKKTTVTKRLVIRITERRTSARRATYQKNQTEAGIITKTTTKYRKIDSCGGTMG